MVRFLRKGNKQFSPNSGTCREHVPYTSNKKFEYFDHLQGESRARATLGKWRVPSHNLPTGPLHWECFPPVVEEGGKRLPKARRRIIWISGSQNRSAHKHTIGTVSEKLSDTINTPGCVKNIWITAVIPNATALPVVWNFFHSPYQFNSIQMFYYQFCFWLTNIKIMLILKGETFGNREKSCWNSWIILRFSTLSLLMYCFFFI